MDTGRKRPRSGPASAPKTPRLQSCQVSSAKERPRKDRHADRDLDKQAGHSSVSQGPLLFPRLSAHRGHYVTTREPVCDQLGSWDGPRCADEYKLGL